jgi:hypothetical protein
MRIKFWVKAFIPDELRSMFGTDLTFRAKVLEVSSEKDSSFLPLITLFPYLFASYATDQRDFSNDVNASARLTTIIDIPDAEKNAITTNKENYCNPSVQRYGWLSSFFYSCRHEKLTAIPSGQHRIENHDGIIHLTVNSSAANPFFNYCGIDLAPPITIELRLTINCKDSENITIDLSGKISRFPAYEAYIQFDENEPHPLFQQKIKDGNTPFDLFYGTNPIHISAMKVCFEKKSLTRLCVN